MYCCKLYIWNGNHCLDEPSSNLDEENILIIKEMLIKLKDKGKTLIISEHRIILSNGYCR